MASAHTIARLHNPPPPVPAAADMRAQGPYPGSYNGYSGSGTPYEGASAGRRLGTWNPTRLGPTTSLWPTRDLLLARCRDEVRNNPLGTSAVDNFESQCIGNGIKPKWNLKNDALKMQIEREFRLSVMAKSIDYHGLCDFYGLQAVAAREIFEGGEVFIRRHIRPIGWSANPNVRRPMRVPIQFQAIEAEQCPIWLNLNAIPGPLTISQGSVVRTGKEYDPQGRLAAFHMFAEHPGESSLFTSSALRFVRVPSDRMLHVYKPFRAGLLRGQPHLSAVLVLLHELGKYTDATVVAKQIQSMWAGFITKTNPEAEVIPTDVVSGAKGYPAGASAIGYIPPMTALAEVEPGQFTYLYPGEQVTFPQLPQNNDLQSFISTMLHQFAVGIGATYEQVTGDLRGVNLSSIRAGIQEAHRKIEQLIYNVIVTQLCQPLLQWWMDEAVLCGRLALPDYEVEPEQYWDVNWMPSGWQWIDPQKDIEAKQTAVRCGFTSREAVCAETGEDAATIDAQQARDNARTDEMGLVYDIDPRKILVGKEANPEVPEEDQPESQEQDEPPGAAPLKHAANWSNSL